MEVWNGPIDVLLTDFDTHIGHYILAAAVLISFLLWLFSKHDTGLRKCAALLFGGSLSIVMCVLLVHFFPAGPTPPGGMP